MCGRFTLTSLDDQIQDLFDVIEVPQRSRKFNIAPTHPIVVVTRTDGELSKNTQPERLQATLMRWGLVPHFAEKVESFSTFNARAETILEKPTFRQSIERRRCIIPADGFYEWKEMSNYRQPFRFTAPSQPIMAFAGVWDRWTSPDGKEITSAAIITTTPNREAKEIHDRMPVILDPADWQKWLAPDTAPTDAISLLKPAIDELLVAYPVDVRVGNVAFENEEALLKAEIQGALF